MYQIDNSTAANTQPASTAPGTAGWFTDGNAAGGVPATIVPAEWLNALQMELCNLVTNTGQTLTKNKFTQVTQAIQSGKLNYGTDGGVANAYAVTYALPLGALFTGLVLSFQAEHSNTGASTLNVSGLGASPIFGMGNVALQGGEIQANGFIEVTWNASLNSGAGAWVLLEQTGGPTQVATATKSQHAATIGQVQADSANYAVDSGTANAYAISLTPAITALTDGLPLTFRAANSNTGPSTLNVNGLGAKIIRNNAGQPLVGSEIVAGLQISVVWNSSTSAFVIQNQQMTGRLLVPPTSYLTSGTFTFTPQPTTTLTRVRIAGGGGAGGGTQATGSTAATAGAGGNPGGYAEFWISNFNSGTATVVIGTGGAGSAGNPGGNGSQSSFTTAGSSVVVPGGTGGNAGAAFTTFPDVVNGPGSNAAITSSGGTLLIASRGGAGFPGIALSTSVVIAGRAGSNPVAGDSDLALSAGGNGAAAGSSTAAQAGFSGENGFCIVEEYS